MSMKEAPGGSLDPLAHHDGGFVRATSPQQANPRTPKALNREFELSTKKRTRVRILATGGTIAGSADRADAAASYTAATVSLSAILDTVPGLSALAEIDARQIAAIDSKDADPGFWQDVARQVREALDAPDVDAVVVLHGTDTMEESAWFVQLTLKPSKPVVFTGAMRPANALSADGPMNVLQAVRVATDTESGRRGVLAVMNGAIHSARFLRKAHSSHVHAFTSGAAGLEGEVFDTVNWFRLPFASSVGHARCDGLTGRNAHTGQNADEPIAVLGEPIDASTVVDLDTDIDDLACLLATPLPRVDILVAYPGASTDVIAHVVRAGAQGIVFAGTGQGTLSGPIQAALADARASGVAVVRASKVDEGQVGWDIGCPDDALGFMTSGGLSADKARVALMVRLASANARTGVRTPLKR
ncbi:asparaginase [Schauerella aestuarii]|uniref:asparaginase n=1 Tax=Schauerella aestuarii TaxID=2511204 RepID=UPI00136E08FD|nr:asparaginase [Achromobacter aestuarii]MYZ41764.1 asparaginase [Achromobacter aestuarii]